jgi:hypothetical protein
MATTSSTFRRIVLKRFFAVDKRGAEAAPVKKSSAMSYPKLSSKAATIT